jgi:hypothetical protein
MAGAYQSGVPCDSIVMISFYPCQQNTRLGWLLMTVANTVAYHETIRITAVKSFIVQALCLCNGKHALKAAMCQTHTLDLVLNSIFLLIRYISLTIDLPVL